MENRNASQIATLRQAADWLDEHPELPRVYLGCIGVFPPGKDQKAEVALVAKAMGHAKKNYLDSSIHLTKNFGDGTKNFGDGTISYVADRDKVCERVQVGTRIEPSHTIPARDEQFIPEHEVAVFEWKCSPVLEPADEHAASAKAVQP